MRGQSMPGLGPGAPSCWVIKIGDTRSCPVPNNFGEIEASDARISSCNEKTAYRIAGAAEESSMAEGVVARVLACSGWYDGDSEACKKTENFGDFLLSDFARLGQVPAVTQGRSRPRHPRKPTPRSSRARSSSLERNLPFFISRPEFSQAFVRRRVNWSLGKLVQGNRSRRFRTTFRPPFRSSKL